MNFLKKYAVVIISIVISILICVGMIALEDSLNAKVHLPLIRLICDGTFITAVLYVSVGGLVFISGHGGFDAFNYAFIKLKDAILHPRRVDRSENDTYFDYVQEKHKKKKTPFLHFFIIGLVYLVIAIVLVFFTPDVPIENFMN